MRVVREALIGHFVLQTRDDPPWHTSRKYAHNADGGMDSESDEDQIKSGEREEVYTAVKETGVGRA